MRTPPSAWEPCVNTANMTGFLCYFIFKMEAEARREARRKRILQNSDSRLQRILDSKSSEEKIHQESTVTLNSSSNQDETVSDESKPQNENEQFVEKEGRKESKKPLEAQPDEEISTSTSELPSKTVGPPSERITESQVPKERVRLGSAADKLHVPHETVKDECDSMAKPCLRVGLNVTLALLLVILSSIYNQNQVGVF